MRKTQTDSLKTRQKLLQAALIVFDRKGVARASLNEISAEAGLTRGALYWHFKNKEDIFVAVCEEKFKLVKKITTLNRESLSWEEEYSGFYHFFSVLEQDSEVQTLLRIIHLKCEHTEDNQAIVRILEKYRQIRDGDILQLLENGKQFGVLPADLSTQFGLVILRSALVGLEVSWLIHQDFPLAKMAKMVFDQCIATLKSAVNEKTQ